MLLCESGFCLFDKWSSSGISLLRMMLPFTKRSPNPYPANMLTCLGGPITLKHSWEFRKSSQFQILSAWFYRIFNYEFMLWHCSLFVLKPLGLILAFSAVFGEGSGVKLDAVATPPAADAKVKNCLMFLSFYMLCVVRRDIVYWWMLYYIVWFPLIFSS